MNSSTSPMLETIDLSMHGSAERGYSCADALTFLSCIEKEKLAVYGIEVWERTEIGYRLDGLAGWYSDTSLEDVVNFESARCFLQEKSQKSELIFTIQHASARSPGTS